MCQLPTLCEEHYHNAALLSHCVQTFFFYQHTLFIPSFTLFLTHTMEKSKKNVTCVLLSKNSLRMMG